MLITFNFEVHQPHRLNKEINQNGNTLWEKYVDTKLNKEVLIKWLINATFLQMS